MEQTEVPEPVPIIRNRTWPENTILNRKGEDSMWKKHEVHDVEPSEHVICWESWRWIVMLRQNQRGKYEDVLLCLACCAVWRIKTTRACDSMQRYSQVIRKWPVVDCHAQCLANYFYNLEFWFKRTLITNNNQLAKHEEDGR